MRSCVSCPFTNVVKEYVFDWPLRSVLQFPQHHLEVWKIKNIDIKYIWCVTGVRSFHCWIASINIDLYFPHSSYAFWIIFLFSQIDITISNFVDDWTCNYCALLADLRQKSSVVFIYYCRLSNVCRNTLARNTCKSSIHFSISGTFLSVT